MALATRCPYCQTTFRVAHDQLKLRAGLVRCGACKQIFNGVEHLLGTQVASSLPDTQQAKTSASFVAPVPSGVQSPPNMAVTPDAPATPSTASHSKAISDENASEGAASTESAFLADSNSPTFPSIHLQAAPLASITGQPAPIPSRQHTLQAVPDADPHPDGNPLTRMTLMDFTAFDEPENGKEGTPEARPAVSDTAGWHAAATEEEPDELDQAIEDLRRRPWRGARGEGALEDADPEMADEPDFVRDALRQQRKARMLRWLLGISSFLLALLLAGQAAYIFRDFLAARFPAIAPALQYACGVIGCQIGLPAQIEAISLEASELQSVSGSSDTFMLSMLLRNQGAIVQAWPSIELTLNDPNEKPIARKVFSPADYLASSELVNAGFPERTEQPVKLLFQLDGLSASGFRVYLFYP